MYKGKKIDVMYDSVHLQKKIDVMYDSVHLRKKD